MFCFLEFTNLLLQYFFIWLIFCDAQQHTLNVLWYGVYVSFGNITRQRRYDGLENCLLGENRT